MTFDIQIGGEPSPARGRGGAGKYAPIAEAARVADGEWIHVAGILDSVAVGIRRSELKGFKDGRYDATMRDIDQDTKLGTLWVRWLGEKEDSVPS